MKSDASSGGRQMRVAAELPALGLVRSALDDMLARAGWGGDEADRVLLAAGEALANAVEHGSVAGAQIEVWIATAPTQARVRIRDEGRPGEPHPTHEPVAPPLTSARGRGRLIMARLADRLEVGPAGAGTEVMLEFARSTGVCTAPSCRMNGALAPDPLASSIFDASEEFGRAATRVRMKLPAHDTNMAT
jgi:anti-sigma regulatory factor (Ser/Thr protein kinase)